MKKSCIYTHDSYFICMACKTENNKQTTEQTSEVVEETIAYASYGDSITPNNAIKVEECMPIINLWELEILRR